MMLSSAIGNSLELQILNYQYPVVSSDKHDANWLLIKIAVRTPDDSRKATAACLLTWELATLATWFESLATDRA